MTFFEEENKDSENKSLDEDLFVIPKPKVNNIKKYVIQIYPENVDFMDSLLPTERTKIINEMLALKQNLLLEDAEQKRVIKGVNHILLIVISVVILIPILIATISLSISATMKNNVEMQKNFEKLYYKN